MKLLLGLAAAVVLSAVVIGSWPEAEQAVLRSAPESSRTSVSPAFTRGGTGPAQNNGVADFEPLPSHENTAIDGGIVLDDNGDVVPERSLRRLFDYFLTGIGRDDIAGLRKRLAAMLVQQNLPEKVQQQTLARFDLYVEYQRRLGDIEAPSGDSGDLLRAYQERRDLRVGVLGREMADGFFAREEAEDRYVLGMKTLEEAEHLSLAERQARQDLLLQQLPEDIREARERTAVAVILEERTRQLRQSGASEVELWRLREEIVGTEAAERLASLDKGRAQWQERLSAYRAERDQLLAADGLAPEDQQAALDNLIERNFEDNEARRVRALERMEKTGAR